MLTESEARKLAIVFEETAKYQREQQRKAERESGGGFDHHGVEGGHWETTFEFGEDDPNDYYDRPDITEGQPIN